MAENLNSYLDYVNAPWGKLFYEIVWKQLEEPSDKEILDFGSGFGVTASHLAENNNVTAVEPDEEMIKSRFSNNQYKQIRGGYDWIKREPSNKYDIIICHNVLEYVNNRVEIIYEFARLLKPNGILSVVKHNRLGKVMQKAVFEYKIDEALALLDGENVKSNNFGTISTYDNEDLANYSKGKLYIDKCFGVRTFYALQNNDVKTAPDWMDKMLELELKASAVAQFRDVAFFNHVILRKSL